MNYKISFSSIILAKHKILTNAELASKCGSSHSHVILMQIRTVTSILKSNSTVSVNNQMHIHSAPVISLLESTHYIEIISVQEHSTLVSIEVLFIVTTKLPLIVV